MVSRRDHIHLLLNFLPNIYVLLWEFTVSLFTSLFYFVYLRPLLLGIYAFLTLVFLLMSYINCPSFSLSVLLTLKPNLSAVGKRQTQLSCAYYLHNISFLPFNLCHFIIRMDFLKTMYSGS